MGCLGNPRKNSHQNKKGLIIISLFTRLYETSSYTMKIAKRYMVYPCRVLVYSAFCFAAISVEIYYENFSLLSMD